MALLLNCQGPKPGRSGVRVNEKAIRPKVMKVSRHHQITSYVISQLKSPKAMSLKKFGSAEHPDEVLKELMKASAHQLDFECYVQLAGGSLIGTYHSHIDLGIHGCQIIG